MTCDKFRWQSHRNLRSSILLYRFALCVLPRTLPPTECDITTYPKRQCGCVVGTRALLLATSAPTSAYLRWTQQLSTDAFDTQAMYISMKASYCPCRCYGDKVVIFLAPAHRSKLGPDYNARGCVRRRCCSHAVSTHRPYTSSRCALTVPCHCCKDKIVIFSMLAHRRKVLSDYKASVCVRLRSCGHTILTHISYTSPR